MLTELSLQQRELLDCVQGEWLDRLVAHRQVSKDAVEDGLRWLCRSIRFEPRNLLVVDGPLEAQAAFFEHGPRSEKPRKERLLDRRLTREVWWPAIDQISNAVSHPILLEVKSQLNSAFSWLQFQFKQCLKMDLMNTSCGSGLAMDLYAVAFLDFFERLGVLDHKPWKQWREVSLNGLWGTFFDGDLAIAVTLPVQMCLLPGKDYGHQLHSIDGPALTWRDGTQHYFLRGSRFCGALVENPGTITMDKIYFERNLRRKQDIIALIGMENFLERANFEILDQDRDRAGMPRRLMRVWVGHEEEWCLIEVCCPSKGDLHYIWVPPHMTRCSQAVAWTFGFETPDYSPLVEA